MSAAGWILGIVIAFGGFLAVAAYIFIVSLKADNDPKVLLLGKRRAAE